MSNTSLAVHVGLFVRWDQPSIPPVFYSHAQSHLILLLLRLLPLFLPSLFWHSVSPCFCYSLLPIWRSSGFEEGKERGSFLGWIRSAYSIQTKISRWNLLSNLSAFDHGRSRSASTVAFHSKGREGKMTRKKEPQLNSSKRNGKRVRLFCPTYSSIIWSCPIINSNHLRDEITDHGN